MIEPIWVDLRQNRFPAGTVRAEYYDVVDRDGRTLRFRDMRGGNSIRADDESQDHEALSTAAGALLFIEWPGRNAVQDLIAVENALAWLPSSCPRALVITKCEGALVPADFAAFADLPGEFLARTTKVPEALRHVAGLFESKNIYPVTTFGYHADGTPASCLDEFGRILPCGIAPRNIDRAFAHVLQSPARWQR